MIADGFEGRGAMEREDRSLLMTAAWLFARHGQGARARALCEALVEENPKDGVSALAAAELMLADNDAESALKALRRTVCPRGMERAEALLETRALVALGLRDEGARRWRRYVNSTVSDRKWVK